MRYQRQLILEGWGPDAQQKLSALDVQQSEQSARLFYISYKAGRNNILDVQTANNQALQQKLTGTVTLPVYVCLTPDGEVKKKYESSTRDVTEFLSFLKSGRS